MNELVNKCLDMIIGEDVDEVLYAMERSYFWIFNRNPNDASETRLKTFLQHISVTLQNMEYKRRELLTNVNLLSEKNKPRAFKTTPTSPYRNQESINHDIQTFLFGLSTEESLEFLGKLVGAYCLSVPEPLFRSARSFMGLHKTPDIPAVDDRLPMTDDMILFAWQYFWFYSWLGN